MPEEVSRQPSDEDLALWRKYFEAAIAMTKARSELFQKSSSLVELLHACLYDPAPRPYALELVGFLKEDERKQLFPDLLSLASSFSGATSIARELILELPGHWVFAHIEEAAEPLLRDGTYEEYREIFELYIRLDKTLARKLALRAAQNADADINEAGQDFLAMLEST